MATNTRILHLTLTKHWFDLIKTGIKREEYREIKKYWHTRLFNIDSSPKIFDFIKFTNGYAKNSPFIYAKHIDTFKSNGYTKWGAELDKLYYVLEFDTSDIEAVKLSTMV